MMKLFRFFLFLVTISIVWNGVQAAEDTGSKPADNDGVVQLSTEQARDLLVKVLENPQSRQVLVDSLKGHANSAVSDNSGQPETQQEDTEKKPTSALPSTPLSSVLIAPSSDEPTQESEKQPEEAEREPLAVTLANLAKHFLEQVGETGKHLESSFSGLYLLLSGQIKITSDRVEPALWDVGSVTLTAWMTFFLCQFFWTRITLHQMGLVPRWPWKKRLGLSLVFMIADFVIMTIGWLAGYYVAELELPPLTAKFSMYEGVALVTFGVVCFNIIVLRFLFAKGRDAIRIIPLQDEAIRYWSNSFTFLIILLGYGLLLIVPVLNLSISFIVGHTFRVLIVLIALISLFAILHGRREKVAQGLRSAAAAVSSELLRKALVYLAGGWNIFIYMYILTVFGVWLTSPVDAVSIVIEATSLSVLAVLVGGAISYFVTWAISDGVWLPDNLRHEFPALQNRLNSFIPRLLKLFRFFVFVSTVLVILDIWGVIDLWSWMASAEGQQFLDRYSSAVLILLIAFAVWLAVMSWIDIRLSGQFGNGLSARSITLYQLFRNAFTVIIVLMAALLSLSEIGIDIGPLIAGAGVIGLAISFGAQTLVKDIITGAFIQIENAINQGDVITVCGITGTVEHLTVRSVRLRDLEGTTHIIPFSEVNMVANFMRDFSYHLTVIGVSYDTNIEDAKAALQEAFDRLKDLEYGSKILGDLEIHGVVSFGDSAVNIRVRIKTLPGQQWAVGRAYNELVKQVFDEQGIEIPFPQVTYHAAASIPQSHSPQNTVRKKPGSKSEEKGVPDNNDVSGAGDAESGELV